MAAVSAPIPTGIIDASILPAASSWGILPASPAPADDASPDTSVRVPDTLAMYLAMMMLLG